MLARVAKYQGGFLAATSPWLAAVARADSMRGGSDSSAPIGPVPPTLLWPGVAIIVIVAIFVAAAIAGPLIRANMRDEQDDASQQRGLPPD